MNLNPKLSAAGVAGAVSVLCIFVLEQVGVEVPPEVASAITTVVAVAVGYLRSQGDWAPKQ